MNVPAIILPYGLSLLIGDAILRLLGIRARFVLRIALAAGLGLGIGAQVSFLCLAATGAFRPPILYITHILLLAGLSLLARRRGDTAQTGKARPVPDLGDLLFLGTALTAGLLLGRLSGCFPYGGWDAWQVWNLKAKFIFLGGRDWTDLLDPVLWRSSPHYPLLLPLINSWGWSLLHTPIQLVPRITAILFTLATSGLLYGAIRSVTSIRAAALGPAILLFLPAYQMQAVSQYADVVLGFYILAALVTWTHALTVSTRDHPEGWAALSGLFTGCVEFTKPEGLVAGGILTLIALAGGRQGLRRAFLIAALIGSIAVVLFQIHFSPGNQTFINGWTSTDHPATMERWRVILTGLLNELTRTEWIGPWGLVLGGLLIGFARKTILGPSSIPSILFLFGYTGAVLLYYQTNTYFEIVWWLQMTLERTICVTLAPVAIHWAFRAALCTPPGCAEGLSIDKKGRPPKTACLF